MPLMALLPPITLPRTYGIFRPNVSSRGAQ